MADIKKVKLPDNSEYNIKDYRIPGVDTEPTSGSDNVITSGGIYAANYAGSTSNGGPANMTVSIPFAKPDATSTSTAYTVQVDGITELRDGVCFYLMNDRVTSASGFTVNVNDLGAKRVYLTTAAATRATTQMAVNYTWLLVYNETRYSSGCWDLVYTFNSNTTYTLNYLFDGSPWYVQHTLYRYQLMFQVNEKTVTPLNANSNTTGTTKTIHTDYEFDPFGKIFYYSTTSTVSANTTVGATYCAFVRAAVDLRYTFNVSTSVNPLSLDYSPVYLKININSTTGMATLNSNLPLTQTLPTTNDGIYYLYLGRSTTTKYTCSLEAHHPIYYHNGTALCELIQEETLNGIEDKLNFVAISDYEDDTLVISAALNDLNDRTLDLEDAIQNVDSEEMTSITWQDLVDLRDNSELKPGHRYRITDYVTRVQFEECRSMEHQFDVIVVADSTNTLNEDAKAILHEGDSYFNEFQNTDSGIELNFRHSHIEGWELKYCLDNDRDRFYWACDSEYIESYIEQNYGSYIFDRNSSNDIDGLYCWSIYLDEPGISIALIYTKVEHPSIGTTVYDSDGETELGEISNYGSGPGKGVIYYMKDDQNNVAEYDFKNVQFLKRFNGFDESSNNYNFDSSGSDQEWFYPLTFHLIDDNNDPVSHYLADASMVSKIYTDEIYPDYNNSGSDCKNNYLGRIDAYNCIVATEINSYYPATLPYDWFVETSGGVLEANGTDSKVQSWRFMARYSINKGNNWSNYDEWLATSKAIDNRITDRTQYMVEYGPTLYRSNMSGWEMMVFEWIPEFGTSADIYLKTTDSNYAWTLSVSTDYLSVSYSVLAHWYSYTPTTLDSDGMYYVKLGTVSSTNRFLCVKGTNANVGSGNANTYCKFHITAPCYVYGNIMSLIGKTTQNDISDNTFNVSYLFNNLFKDEVNLFSHPSYRLFMTSTRIPSYSCRNMFDGCKNMTVSPYMSCTDLGNQYCFVDILNNTDNLKCVITGDLTSTVVSRCVADKKYNELYYMIGKNVSGSAKALYTSYSIKYPLVSMIAHLLNHSLFEKIKQQQLHTSSDYSVDPNKLFGFGTITGSITFTLSSKEDSITSNHYFWTFNTGSTAPTITWPSGLTWPGGSPPAILPNKHYEISVLNNIVAWMEV